MLVKFSEQTIGHFHVPSFTLSQGELVIIQHPNIPEFTPASSKLIDLLTGKVRHPSVEVSTPLRYVRHIRPEGSLWHRLFPLTVKAYQNKHANKERPVYKTIYESEWISPRTDIRTVPADTRQKISLYTTLSWTNNIIFDFAGMDPKGCQEMYDVVKEAVSRGGSAILIDFSDAFINDCTSIITASRY